MGPAGAAVASASRAWPPPLLAAAALPDALFYVRRTGCAWRYLPREYPPWQTTWGSRSNGTVMGRLP